MRIRTLDGVFPFFLGYQMCASDFRQRMEKVKKATTSVAAVYQKDLLPLAIALPPESEQIRIVAEVDRHLSIIREVEAEVDTNLQRAQALRQATLASAFGVGSGQI
jgi:type I restriction enzyme S subunit